MLALEPQIAGSGKLGATIAEIRKTAAEDIGEGDLRVQLSGVPVMQLEIRNAVERDRLIYNTVGFLAGCIIAMAFFRRVSFMIVRPHPP